MLRDGGSVVPAKIPAAYIITPGGVKFMIKYRDYKKLGYSAVPKEQFAGFADTAEKAVKKFCSRRVLPGRVSEDMKRGLCGICDIYYAENQGGRRLAGFSNDSYREQYFDDISVNTRVYELIQLYFPSEYLFRGV
jgi:hypothetical protein